MFFNYPCFSEARHIAECPQEMPARRFYGRSNSKISATRRGFGIVDGASQKDSILSRTDLWSKNNGRSLHKTGVTFQAFRLILEIPP